MKIPCSSFFGSSVNIQQWALPFTAGVSWLSRPDQLTRLQTMSTWDGCQQAECSNREVCVERTNICEHQLLLIVLLLHFEWCFIALTFCIELPHILIRCWVKNCHIFNFVSLFIGNVSNRQMWCWKSTLIMSYVVWLFEIQITAVLWSSMQNVGWFCSWRILFWKIR